MKASTILLTVLLVAFADGEAEAKAFDLRSQVGVVDTRSRAEVCFTIPNANLVEGSEVRIVSPYKPQSVATAVVERKLSASCSRNPDTSPEDVFYSLKLISGKVEPESVGIGVVDAGRDFRVANDLASIDLNRDGRREYFRVCTSQEGLHLTIWSGKPLRGTRMWHWYYYLGYDVEPSCSRREVR